MESILEGASGYYAETAWLLEGAMGCLLLISCANVSSLLLAKGLERMNEMVVRSCLGASRGRLISQILIETVVLSSIGVLPA
jgi:putative ABC transport system permease protein